MRQAGYLCAFVILLMVLALFPAVADEQTENIDSLTIESFDNPEEIPWRAVGSKFTAEGYPQIAFPEAWPSALFGNNPDGVPYKVLGVHGKFNRPGYNYIEIIPDVRDDKGNLVGISIPGVCQSISLWAWGSNHNFYLDIHLMDFDGSVHVLKAGELNFNGWKNLKITIPSAIKQRIEKFPEVRDMSLMKFVLWTRPGETVDDFYFYMDQIKVMTNILSKDFDGYDLTTEKRIEEIWGGAPEEGEIK